MTRSLVAFIINYRNYFPQKGIIRKRLGENTILLGNPNSDFNMKRIFFGYYSMVYKGKNNNTSGISIPRISLGESN